MVKINNITNLQLNILFEIFKLPFQQHYVMP